MTRPVIDRPRPYIDLTSAGLYRDGFPHDVFSALRRDTPVAWQAFPEDLERGHDDGFWVVTKHADVQAANRDTELFSALDGPSLTVFPEVMRGTMLISMDGRDHVRQRRLISAGFTPRMIAQLEEQARRWASSIVDQALEKQTCNFVSEIAYRLPMHMIADIVGIPVGDREWLFDLTNQFLLGGNGTRGSEDEHLAIQLQMFEYAQELGRQKRSDPQDDVWTILSTAEVETDDGERTSLGEVELDLFFLLLTLAGSETTRNAISGGLVALLAHPDQLERLREEPDAMKPAVEEILRWVSPVSYFARRATRDTDIGGIPIAEGERVALWYPSANRDEDVFDDPFRFDITRTPNPHVAFGGGGAHFCLGANLARREIAILFEELLARTSHIEILGPPEFNVLGIFNPVLIAMGELPVRLA